MWTSERNLILYKGSFNRKQQSKSTSEPGLSQEKVTRKTSEKSANHLGKRALSFLLPKIRVAEEQAIDL
jgi:hypothetical protein